MQNIFLRLFVTLRMEGVDRNRGGDRMNTYHPMVTLRMEGVDRNAFDHMEDDDDAESPSAWRVWIEILYILAIRSMIFGHPPHGGCG